MGHEIKEDRRLPKQGTVRMSGKGKRAWRQAEVLLAIHFLKSAGTFLFPFFFYLFCALPFSLAYFSFFLFCLLQLSPALCRFDFSFCLFPLPFLYGLLLLLLFVLIILHSFLFLLFLLPLLIPSCSFVFLLPLLLDLVSRL